MVKYNIKRLIQAHEENEKARNERNVDYRRILRDVANIKRNEINNLSKDEVDLLKQNYGTKIVLTDHPTEKQIATIIDYRLDEGGYRLGGRMGGVRRGMRAIPQGTPTLAYYATHPVNAIKRFFGYRPTAVERAKESYPRLQKIAQTGKGILPKEINKGINDIQKYGLYQDMIQEMQKDKLIGRYNATSLEHALDRKTKSKSKDITDKIKEDIISTILILAGAFFISMSREGMYFTGNLVKEQSFVAINGLGIGVILLIAALVVLFVKVLLRKH